MAPPADEAETYHRMHKWYNSSECDALRAAWGAYPATPGALQAWPGFVAVTNAFLDDEAASDRSAAAAGVEPVAAEAEESEPVGASDVVAEVMERETPAEAATDEPRGWLSSLLGPRREGGAAVDTEASKPETEQAGGNTVGSLEFIGLWKENKEKQDRLMPIKREGGIAFEGWQKIDFITYKIRVALGKLVDELVRSKAPSGILAITFSRSQRTDDQYSCWGISWSASADDERYQRLGLVSAEPDRHDESIRFADFDGAIDVFGDPASEANAVYRVTLPSGGLDPDKWAGRPLPPAPADLHTGPRDDGLLSTDEISGDYYAGCSPPFECYSSMTVVPLGADTIETWRTGCLFYPLPPLLVGKFSTVAVTTRKPGTNNFGEGGWFEDMTFLADGTFKQGSENDVYHKRPNSQKRAFHKIDARDLAGNWCGCCYGPVVPAWPFSCFCCTTKKALDQDRYEESGLCCFVGLPIPVSETRTRRYVNGLPTNGFAPEGGGDDGHWYRDPGWATDEGGPAPTFCAKKIC